MRKVEIKFIGKTGIQIPKLKGKPKGARFPLINHITGEPLPEKEQVYTLYECEASDLIRCWPNDFVLNKKTKKEVSELKIDAQEVNVNE